MEKNNMKNLYESIMTSVAKEVKKALNEGENNIYHVVTIWTDPENLNIENAVCEFSGTLEECKEKINIRLNNSKKRGFIKCYEFDNNLGYYGISYGIGNKLHITLDKIMSSTQLKNFNYLHNGKIKNIR